MSKKTGPSSRQINNFRRVVLEYFEKNGRHTLPWRKVRDPYKILVSEIMLQQTQVDRVIPYYERFLRIFPTVQKLAASDLASVLKIWSGLGYNRRAKLLRDCAREVVEKYSGTLPRDRAALESLPGIGPYTAGAVQAFAFNDSVVLIETNIRTVYIHHFAKIWTSDVHISSNYHSCVLQKTGIEDSEILEIAKRAAEGQGARKWHWALMDYGAYLKRSGVKLNQKSAHFTKQSKFEGSQRQVRGAILRALKTSASEAQIFRRCHLGVSRKKIREALRSLERDGLILKRKGKWQISTH